MLMCKGNGCNWRGQCSRYVLGRGIAARTDISAEWLDHCLRHQDKFIAINSEEGRQVADKLNQSNK